MRPGRPGRGRACPRGAADDDGRRGPSVCEAVEWCASASPCGRCLGCAAWRTTRRAGARMSPRRASAAGPGAAHGWTSLRRLHQPRRLTESRLPRTPSGWPLTARCSATWTAAARGLARHVAPRSGVVLGADRQLVGQPLHVASVVVSPPRGDQGTDKRSSMGDYEETLGSPLLRGHPHRTPQPRPGGSSVMVVESRNEICTFKASMLMPRRPCDR